MQILDKNTWLICIDDTDDIGTKGTGEIAEEIAFLLLDDQREACPRVTRHQLFVHPDIPYTSHNSAMCFKLQSNKSLEDIKIIAVTHLLAQSASAADPGIAILDLSKPYDKTALIKFGQDAKSKVITKAQAYELATDLGVSLSEHGGTGQGVIGALAGLGLRLFGRDGRVKGQVTLEGANLQLSDKVMVADVLSSSELDCVLSTCGRMLSLDEFIYLNGKIKAVYWDHQFALLVYRCEGRWCNALRSHLKDY